MSYKVKFIILFVLFGSIVVTTSSIIAYNGIKKNIVSDFNENVKNIAVLKQNIFVNTLDYKVNILNALSQNDNILSLLHTKESNAELTETVNTIMQADSDFFDISFFDASQKRLTSINFHEKQSDVTIDNTAKDSEKSVKFSVLERHSGKYLLPITKKVYKKDRLLGYIKARVDLSNLFSLFDTTSVAKLYMAKENGDFMIYNDKPNLNKDLNLLKEFGKDTDDLLFADVYIASDLYVQKITIGKDINYRLILKLNNELINEKQKRTFYLNLFLVIGVIAVSIPIAYIFSIVPDNLTRQLKDLNTSLEKRVEEEVYANRAKDQIMFHQSKNAAMGEMISMITHQWRQPLSSIGAVASQVKLMCDLEKLEKDSVKALMMKTIDSTKYLSNTIEDFKNFFKPNKQKEVVALSDVIDEVIKFSSHALTINSIEVIREEDNTIEVEIVKNELLQVLMNLVKNAIDQLAQTNKKREITFKTFTKDNKNFIEVGDNGGGIPSEIIENIFDEYYSTKREGTGLGLYMSQMIVASSLQGSITVTKSDEGALFTISF